jgi:hypothetical protein
MHQSIYDPYLLYFNDDDKNSGFGIVGMQTDDTLLLADDTFATTEENRLREASFLSKDREKLISSNPIKFNGG